MTIITATSALAACTYEKFAAELGPSTGLAERRYYVIPRAGVLELGLRDGQVASFALAWTAGYHRCPGFDEETWLGGTEDWRF